MMHSTIAVLVLVCFSGLTLSRRTGNVGEGSSEENGGHGGHHGHKGGFCKDFFIFSSTSGNNCTVQAQTATILHGGFKNNTGVFSSYAQNANLSVCCKEGKRGDTTNNNYKQINGTMTLVFLPSFMHPTTTTPAPTAG